MFKIKTKGHSGAESFFYRFFYFILSWVFLNFFLVSVIFAEVEITSEPFPAQVLPRNAVNVPFLKIKVKTNQVPIYVKSITVEQKGLSDRSDFEGVLAQARFFRSYTTRFDNEGVAKLKFQRPILIPRDRTEVIDILGHLDSRLGRTLQIDLVSVDWSFDQGESRTKQSPVRFNRGRDFFASQAQKFSDNKSFYKGSRPSSNKSRGSSYKNFRRPTPRNTFGNYFTNRVSSYEVSKITYQSLGVSNRASLRWGWYNRVHRFRLKNTGKKSVYLNSIRFKNRGTADLDAVFDRLEIRDKYNRIIAETESIDRKYVDFVFEDTLISRAQSENFSVWGKMVGGRKNETIQLVLEEVTDLLSSSVDRFTVQAQSIMEDEKKRGSKALKAPIFSKVAGNLSLLSSPNNSVGTQRYNPGSRDVVLLSQSIRPPRAIFFEKVRVFLSPYSLISDKNNNGIKNEGADFEATFEDLTLFIDGAYADQDPEIKFENGQLFLEFEAPTEMERTKNFLVTGRLSWGANDGDRVKLFLDRNKSFPDWEIL